MKRKREHLRILARLPAPDEPYTGERDPRFAELDELIARNEAKRRAAGEPEDASARGEERAKGASA
jgi:hypothetical protein